jgi:hypothetical protein
MGFTLALRLVTACTPTHSAAKPKFAQTRKDAHVGVAIGPAVGGIGMISVRAAATSLY